MTVAKASEWIWLALGVFWAGISVFSTLNWRRQNRRLEESMRRSHEEFERRMAEIDKREKRLQ